MEEEIKMNIITLQAIAKLAEDKHVRIELLPEGFRIIAKAVKPGKGMVKIEQMISYTKAEAFNYRVDMFEAVIDTTIARLNNV